MTPRSVRLSKVMRRELDRISGDRVVVTAVMAITAAEAGNYADLGQRVEDGTVKAGVPVLLPPSFGIHARRNLDGWDEKRTDLPKERRTVSSWAQSWNSGSYHLVSLRSSTQPSVLKVLTTDTRFGF